MATRKAVMTIIAEFDVNVTEDGEGFSREDVEDAAKEAADSLRCLGEVTFGELVFMPAKIELPMESIDLT